MSVEKISSVYAQSIQVLKEQKEIIKKTREELFLLGKNNEDYTFLEFRKKLRGLIFSIDLEKCTNELNALLSKVDSLINQNQSSSTMSNDIQAALQLKKLLKDQEGLLNSFKEAMLELRNIKHSPPENSNQKTQDKAQIKIFKNYLEELSRQAQQMFPSLRKSLGQRANIISIRGEVLLNLLSQFSYEAISSEGNINSLIRRILDGFSDNQISKCKKNPEDSQFRISMSPKGRKLNSDMDIGSASSARPVFSFTF